MGEVAILSREQDSMLRAFLQGDEKATVYHTPEWRDTIVSTYGYEPFYLGYLDDGRIRAVLPLMLVRSWLTGTRLVSLPFSNICGPTGDERFFDALLAKALEIYSESGAKAVEIRTQADLATIEDERFSNVSYFITSIMDLDPDPESLWTRIKDGSVRTEVRQAIKKGVEFRLGKDPNDLRVFYDLFAGNRLKHGVPVTRFEFFENLWNNLGSDMRVLFLAYYKGQPAAAVLALGYNKVIAEAYLGADAKFLSYRVNQMVIWKGIEWACRNGYEKWDFLRTPKTNKGLKFFKAKWGVTEIDLNYLYYPEVAGTASTVEESTKYKLVTSVLKRSPAFVGRMLGRLLYKHLG